MFDLPTLKERIHRLVYNKNNQIKDIKSQIYQCWIFPENSQNDYGFDLPSKTQEPLKLRESGLNRIIGRKIEKTWAYLGTYGPGTCNFFGLQLEKNNEYPNEFLVLTLWKACSWIHLNDVILDNDFQDMPQVGYKNFKKYIENHRVLKFEVWDKHCKMVLSNDVVLEVKLEPNTRPKSGLGNEEFRTFALNDSLWDAWVLTERDLFI